MSSSVLLYVLLCCMSSSWAYPQSIDLNIENTTNIVVVTPDETTLVEISSLEQTTHVTPPPSSSSPPPPPMQFVSDRPDTHPVRGVDGKLSSLRDYAVTIINSCDLHKCIVENCERIQNSKLFNYTKCIEKVAEIAVERVHKLRADVSNLKDDLVQVNRNLEDKTKEIANITAEKSKMFSDATTIILLRKQCADELEKVSKIANACNATMSNVMVLTKRNAEYQLQVDACNNQLTQCTLDKETCMKRKINNRRKLNNTLESSTTTPLVMSELSQVQLTNRNDDDDNVFEKLLIDSTNVSRISEFTPKQDETAILSDHFKVGGLFVAIALGIKALYVVCCYTIKRWCRRTRSYCCCGCCEKCLGSVELHETQPINKSSSLPSSSTTMTTTTTNGKTNKKAPYVSMKYSKKQLNASTTTLPIVDNV